MRKKPSVLYIVNDDGVHMSCYYYTNVFSK